jgi:hypothetical protein
MRLRIRSLRIIAELIQSWVVTIITDAEMGEEGSNPKKGKHVKATPKNAAAIIRGKSLRAIFLRHKPREPK